MDTALFEDQSMALRKEDKVWIAEEIRAAIQEHLQPKVWRRLKEWIPLAAIISSMIALLGLSGAGWNYAFTRIREEATFQANTTNKLKEIEGRLGNLALARLSELDQPTFAKSLHTLREVMKQPGSEVKPSRETVNQIADKLRNTRQDAEGYWPAAIQFVNFASAGLAADVPPPGQPNFVFMSNIGIAPGVVTGKIVLLSGGEVLNSRFENSRIIFTDTPVVLKNVQFVNCVFEIPVHISPSDYIKKATEILLASDLKSASVASL